MFRLSSSVLLESPLGRGMQARLRCVPVTSFPVGEAPGGFHPPEGASFFVSSYECSAVERRPGCGALK